MSESSNVEKKQELSRQIIGKIVNDPSFREKLSTDPVDAMKDSGFWETYRELYGGDAEVSGYELSPITFSDYCCVTGIY